MTEKLEEIKTPDYSALTARFVNASLDEFRNRLAGERESRQGLSEAQERLNRALTDFRYDGVQTAASSLQKKLDPFSEEELGYELSSPFKRFVADLEYIELLEKGSLGAVNGRVAELFEQAKGLEMSPEQQEELVGRLNDIMMRGIYIFPHLAKGVEVKLKPGVEGRTKKFEEVYGRMGYYRRVYDRLLEAYQRVRGRPLSNTLIFSLPFGFTTGTHGSGERAAVVASQEHVYFTFIHPRDDWQTKVPALALSLEAPLIMPHYSLFTLDEIDSIQFTDKGDFVSYVDRHREGEILIEKPNFVNYYFGFRNFFNYRMFRSEKIEEFSNEEWNQCQENLAEPGGFGNLWREDFRTNKLVKGFLAVCHKDPDKVELYEFTDIELPSRDRHEAAAILYINFSRGMYGTHIRSYTGNEAIQKLAEIPIEKRRF